MPSPPVYVPANFERDLKAERRPQVVAFYNQQFLTAAGVASSSLSDTLAAAANSWRPRARAAPARPASGRSSPRTIVLVNPTEELRAVSAARAAAGGRACGRRACRRLFGGVRVRRRSVRTWLACAGGNPIIALAGKLAPLFGIFSSSCWWWC